MQRISILIVAETPAGSNPDLLAQGLCEEVRRRGKAVELVEDRVLGQAEGHAAIEALGGATPCAVVLVGGSQTPGDAEDWMELHPRLVVVTVPIGSDSVLFEISQPSLGQLVDAIQGLLENGQRSARPSTFACEMAAPSNDLAAPRAVLFAQDAAPDEDVLELETDDVIVVDKVEPLPPPRELLDAAVAWSHHLLRRGASRLFARNGESVDFTRAPLADWLDRRGPFERLPLDDEYDPEELPDLTAALERALGARGGPVEPLAIACQELGLNDLEFRLLVLALAPEFDPRHQLWIALLADGSGAGVGTLAVYASLLGIPAEVVVNLARSGQLARWRVFDGASGSLPPADAPLRVDPPLRAWLLGAPASLEQADPLLRRTLRMDPWPGARLVTDRDAARELVEDLDGERWLILAGDGGPATWRALLEAGAAASERTPLRARLDVAAALGPDEAGELGVRLARLARLSQRPLVLDAAAVEAGTERDEAIGALLAAVGAGEVAGAVIAADAARIARLLGRQQYRLAREVSSGPSRPAAMLAAAAEAGVQISREAAESLANLYPLGLDGLDQAVRLALARPVAADAEARRARFITACKEVSGEGASGLAQRIEPIFGLDDVVLPPDRKAQLVEIVDNVLLAPKVLEDWKFRDKLPYGLGVTALFHGPSGTGKTMASMAIARKLQIQLLRLDFSRVASKYIGETEKRIDAVFLEAQQTGAGLLIDEADGLLARRGEVKDAHDRYANLEVSYLLQRMETFEGLCLCTSNLKQNLDPAFLRRLRFIVEFPRPDVAAREEIWKRCLPDGSHTLDEAAFALLGRRIELTGGSIRQITLRAAFLAAAAGTTIRFEHIAHAARAEFAKLGLPPAELDSVTRAA